MAVPIELDDRKSHEVLGAITTYASSPKYDNNLSRTREIAIGPHCRAVCPFALNAGDDVVMRHDFNDRTMPDRVHKPVMANAVAPRHLKPMQSQLEVKPALAWDWDLEHEDRRKEERADAAIHGVPPFQVDRKLLKDIVREKMGAEVARIVFLGAGTFHKGYCITLVDGREVVARVARRFMPRLKTESEVATMQYIRERTSIPVPTVYHHDSNPYNRLGGEFILMSKATGIPLAQVFHSMPHNTLMQLMENVASLIIPLFAHRFSKIGSLYSGPDPDPTSIPTSTVPTPTATQHLPKSFSMKAVAAHMAEITPQPVPPKQEFHVGPIISWPFFGSNRGDLSDPEEIFRGPWPSTYSYLMSCAEREITGVILENEGKAAPHRLHLDPDEIISSRHHHMQALPGDQSDQSDEWDREESEDEWEGPGDSMYRDYRRMQRSTFLVAHMQQREERVKEEMSRFVRMMEKLGVVRQEEGDGGGGEEFALDCHDLSLENIFVDEHDHAKIACIIDWESVTTRPLWACAHVPPFLQSSPFTAKLFRATVEKIAGRPRIESIQGVKKDLAKVAAEWLHHQTAGARLRMAHRCIEWDGWEEGLVESILGPEEQEDDWFKTWEEMNADPKTAGSPAPAILSATSPTLAGSVGNSNGDSKREGSSERKGRPASQIPAKVVAVEKEKEKLLNATGDYCGGRGGELGRRLEAWLCDNGDAEGRVGLSRKWDGDEEEIAVM